MPAQSPRLPKISVIQSFKVAAELGSLAKAAAQLALTPAAVSQQIRQLEEQLGSALFLRTQSGVMLTETGRNICAMSPKPLIFCTSASKTFAMPPALPG